MLEATTWKRPRLDVSIESNDRQQKGILHRYSLLCRWLKKMEASIQRIKEEVKEKFAKRFMDYMNYSEKYVKQLRVKVIVFRDFSENPENAIVETSFF